MLWFRAMLGKVRDQARYTSGLVRFLKTPLSLNQARLRIQEQLARREASFLDVLERGIYANPKSPYRKLLSHAGIGLQDVRQLIGQAGLEASLAELYDKGIYLTLEEARGRVPVQRNGLSFQVGATDLDNPLLKSYFEGVSSGSRSTGRRVFVDFDRLNHDSAYVSQLLDAHGIAARPIAIWRPIPPDPTGLNVLLRYTKVGGHLEQWFSQSDTSRKSVRLGTMLMLSSTILTGRILRQKLPSPQFVPGSEAVKVARWLATKRALGTPSCVDTSASGATRVCLAARAARLDITDSVFVVGGEPYTAAKAAVLASAGTRGIDRYSLTELGTVGLGCANSPEIDDMHVATDKLAVIQRNKVVSSAGETVPALVYTTLLATGSNIWLNTESGDYAELCERDCGCLFERVGLTTHLIGLRSYDKLTSEGVSFMNRGLYELVEELLPARFGGNPTDYQLVEEEEDGLPKVSIVISPDVGEINEADVVATVLVALENYRTGPAMAKVWRQGETLRVLRQEPFTSGSRKILPLHILRKS